MARDLTSGNILKDLVVVAAPVILTSLMQMTYNITDLLWLGKLIDTDAISSAATAGFYVWLASAIFFLGKIGTEIKVAQSMGAKDIDKAKEYARSGIQFTFIISIIYAICLIVFNHELIAFFDIKDINVVKNAENYLFVIAFGIVFYCLNPVFSGAVSGTGTTKIIFVFSAIGLVLNIILDPIFISFNGVKGAAQATVIAQGLMFLLFFFYFKYKNSTFKSIKFTNKLNHKLINEIFRLSLPASIQSALFTIIAMVIGRIVADWGNDAIAVQKIGSQIESLSWLTASGIQTAISAFVGQNIGAKNFDRVKEGYIKALLIMSVYGIFVTLLLVVFPEFLFGLFVNDKGSSVITMGVAYLRILGISQIFMILEITTAGAMNGLGRTIPPSVIGILFNLMRIPGVIILSSIMGLNGIWWAICISSIFKGTLLTIWMFNGIFRDLDDEEELSLQY